MSSWETLSSLAVPRCHAGLVNIQGRLYLVGGRSPADSGGKTVSVDTIERYNTESDQWQLFARLRTARHDSACTAVGMLFITSSLAASPRRLLYLLVCQLDYSKSYE